MTAPHIVDPAGLLGEALAEASPDLMRSLLQSIINTLLSADADAVIGAEYGRPSPGRAAQRNGYRRRDLDTRVGRSCVDSTPVPWFLMSDGAAALDTPGGDRILGRQEDGASALTQQPGPRPRPKAALYRSEVSSHDPKAPTKSPDKKPRRLSFAR
jgi:hypothetical protein